MELENISKEKQLTLAGLHLIANAGKISGNIQEIVYNEMLEERKKNATEIKSNLAQTYQTLQEICKIINVDLEELTKREK